MVLYDLIDGNYYVSIIDTNGCQANSDILGVLLSATHGERFYNINIFPNPTSDYLTIFTEKALHNVNIEIYNNQGQLITHLKSSLPGTIPLHNIPTGIYFLKFTAGKEYYMTKVVLD